MTSLRLGLKPPVPGAIKLRLSTYLNYRQLPTPPPEFGHEGLIKNWGMLGNDQYGCCAPAGACHQSMLLTAEAGAPARYDTAAALKNYSAITGFRPSDPSTDQGTAIADLAHYWRTKGLIDADGKRHFIQAYADLNPGDLRELWVATWLFQSVGLGFDMQQAQMDQFDAGQPWDYVKGSHSVGGHYVPGFARRGAASYGAGVSWGKPIFFTPSFYQKRNNQGIVVFSREMLISARSIDGVDDRTLMDDLRQIAA